MFTGIIEELGVVRSITATGQGGRIAVTAAKALEGTGPGDSISVNGVCLTVVDTGSGRMEMDILKETLDRSTLGKISAGDKVNLERSLTPASRLGGHFVFGHVDCRGKIANIKRFGRDWQFTVSVDRELMPLIAPKGSIAIDGISLTVVDVADAAFTVHVIPHTFEQTTLKLRKTGSEVNVEVDMLARYVQRAISALTGKQGRITEDFLRETGFM